MRGHYLLAGLLICHMPRRHCTMKGTACCESVNAARDCAAACPIIFSDATAFYGSEYLSNTAFSQTLRSPAMPIFLVRAAVLPFPLIICSLTFYRHHRLPETLYMMMPAQADARPSFTYFHTLAQHKAEPMPQNLPRMLRL